MKYKLSQKALEYKPRRISKEYCNNILIEMILNNMKIEGQEVSKNAYKQFRAKMQSKAQSKNQ